MSNSFDHSSTREALREHEGADVVRSSIDWCARCSKRLVGLNPGLSAEDAFDRALDLSLDPILRAKGPESVAEALHDVEPRGDG